MTLGPNGRFLYVVSAGDQALRVFALEPSAGPSCAGDCDGDGSVTVDELVRGVRIALGDQQLDACPAIDADGDTRVAIAELIGAVRSALHGCAQ